MIYKRSELESLLERVGAHISGDFTLLYTNLENGEWDDIEAQCMLREIQSAKDISDSDKNLWMTLINTAGQYEVVA